MYGESKIDPSEKDYIEYISEYEPEDLEQVIIETKVFESEDERNSFFDNYEF